MFNQAQISIKSNVLPYAVLPIIVKISVMIRIKETGKSKLLFMCCLLWLEEDSPTDLQLKVFMSNKAGLSLHATLKYFWNNNNPILSWKVKISKQQQQQKQ